MTLVIRVCLGPYEILSPIGGGATGAVWNGRNLRLVAVKVSATGAGTRA